LLLELHFFLYTNPCPAITCLPEHKSLKYIPIYVGILCQFVRSLFRSRPLSRAIKIILYETLIRPDVSCGAETWTVTEREEQAVLIFGRKIFRRIYSAKYGNGEWKSGTNREPEEMNKGENIEKWIKGQRISWLGHLERMEEDRMPKKIFTQELEGTRRRGRSRKRWKEEVERYLQVPCIMSLSTASLSYRIIAFVGTS